MAEKQQIHSLFQLAHIELFQLAQVIGSTEAEDMQRELDLVRSRVVKQLSDVSDIPGLGEIPMLPHSQTQAFVPWFDYQLTPELSKSRVVTGATIQRRLLKELTQALTRQKRVVSRSVGMRFACCKP